MERASGAVIPGTRVRVDTGGVRAGGRGGQPGSPPPRFTPSARIFL